MDKTMEDAIKRYLSEHKKQNQDKFSDEVVFTVAPILELESEEAEKPIQTGTKNIIAIIGDRFMNGGFLPVEVLKKNYKQWKNTLHDINHMGTSTGFFLMQTDITYFIGYHTDVKFDAGTKEVSMTLNIEPSTHFANDWEAYVKLCNSAGKIPNVSVTYYAKRNFIHASDLPKNVPWKKEGYGKDDLVPVMTQITPVCVSTVLEGRCNDKDGCGIRNDEMPSELEIELEKKRQEIIRRIKTKQLEFEMEDKNYD